MAWITGTTRTTSRVVVRSSARPRYLATQRSFDLLPRLRRVLFGHQVGGKLAHPTRQGIKGPWKCLWPRQSLPVYDDRPLQILDRLSIEGKRQAFTHHSVDHTHNYEELEWVGDAALELLARRMISRKYPQLKLGEKSRLAQTVVRGTALSRIALSIGLAKHIRCHPDKLDQDVLEDVMESLLAVMTEELGDKEAYIWLESVMSEMLEENKRRLYGPAPVLVNVEETVNILHPAHLMTWLQRRWRRWLREWNELSVVVRNRIQKSHTRIIRRISALVRRNRAFRDRIRGSLSQGRRQSIFLWTNFNAVYVQKHITWSRKRLNRFKLALDDRIRRIGKRLKVRHRILMLKLKMNAMGKQLKLTQRMQALDQTVRVRPRRIVHRNFVRLRASARGYRDQLHHKYELLKYRKPELFGELSQTARKRLRRRGFAMQKAEALQGAPEPVPPVQALGPETQRLDQAKATTAEPEQLPLSKGKNNASTPRISGKLSKHLLSQRCKGREIAYKTLKEPTPEALDWHELVVVAGLGEFVGIARKKAVAQRLAAKKMLQSGLLESKCD